MRGYFERRLKLLAPVLMTIPPGLPELEAEEASLYVRRFLDAGSPVLRFLYRLAILVLQAQCLLRRRRSLYSLSLEEARDFLESLYESRKPAMGAAPLFLSMPLYMAYYGRDEVQERLGFPVSELRREARQREVHR